MNTAVHIQLITKVELNPITDNAAAGVCSMQSVVKMESMKLTMLQVTNVKSVYS